MDMNELPEPLRNLFKQLEQLGAQIVPMGHDCDAGKWIQVVDLKPADRLKWQAYKLEDGKRKERVIQLHVQANLLKAQHDKAKSDIWAYLYKAYDLPPDESYKIPDTRRIFRQVENGDQEKKGGE